jgi:hypothetical protein
LRRSESSFGGEDDAERKAANLQQTSDHNAASPSHPVALLLEREQHEAVFIHWHQEMMLEQGENLVSWRIYLAAHSIEILTIPYIQQNLTQLDKPETELSRAEKIVKGWYFLFGIYDCTQPKKAMQLFNAAANQGSSLAYYCLAYLFYTSHYRDYLAIVDLAERAIAGNNCNAMCLRATLIMNRKQEADYPEAIGLLEHSIRLKNSDVFQWSG